MAGTVGAPLSPGALGAADWPRTPLGAPEGWPASLRGIASACAGSALPMAIAWGSHRTLVANRAWRQACDPDGLLAGSDFLRSEPGSRPAIAQAFDRAARGEAACAQDSRGGLGVAHSFSPVFGDDGRVDGVLLALTPLPQLTIGAGGEAESLARDVAALHRLHDLSLQLAESSSLPDSLRAVVDTLVELHGATRGLLSLHDPHGGTLRVGASSGFTGELLDELGDVRPGLESGACGSAFASRCRSVVQDTETDRRFDGQRPFARRTDSAPCTRRR